VFEEQYWADAQLSVKQVFFNFLLVTLHDYSKYLTNDEDLFDFTGFLSGKSEFTKQLLNTQAFY
jgi:hypothetical protein